MAYVSSHPPAIKPTPFVRRGPAVEHGQWHGGCPRVPLDGHGRWHPHPRFLPQHWRGPKNLDPPPANNSGPAIRRQTVRDDATHLKSVAPATSGQPSSVHRRRFHRCLVYPPAACATAVNAQHNQCRHGGLAWPAPRPRAQPRRTLTRQNAGLHRDHVLRPESANHSPQPRSEEHTSELQSRGHLVCRLLLEKKNNTVYVRSNYQL